MSSNATIRITDLTQLNTAEHSDELVIVDKSDTASSSDGTDKRITSRDFLENTPVRPENDAATNLPLKEWLQIFKDGLEGVVERTQNANTTQFGVVRYATAQQAQAKQAYDRALSAGVLSSLDATELMSGLLAIATGQEVAEGQVDNKAVTPLTIFESILGDASIGNNSWVFKIPCRNTVGSVKLELIVQIGQREFDTVQTGANPTTNFNHIHQKVEFDVDYPEQFPTLALMVIPMAFEATPSQYLEGSDFWVRPKEIRQAGATLSATRINGTSPGGELAGVRYIAIGF